MVDRPVGHHPTSQPLVSAQSPHLDPVSSSYFPEVWVVQEEEHNLVRAACPLCG